MKRILFFGPYSPPITGQSLAFRTIVDAYSEKEGHLLVDTTKYKYKALNTFYCMIRCLWLLLTIKSISTIYFTCSRSMAGSIRDLPMLLLGGAMGKRIVNHLHGADFRSFHESIPKIYRNVLDRSYGYVDTSIVLLEPMKEQFSMFPRMQKIVVPNFYPCEFDKLNFPPESEIMVTFLSNIRQSKGILEVLEAAKEVYQINSSVKFQIAGAFMSDHLKDTNQIKKEVMTFLKSHSNLNINFIGEIIPEHRFQLLSISHIFVLPTYYPTEAFPLSIIEAMRCGNVIITTNHNYLPEIIDEQNGALIEPRNSTSLADAILNFVNDEPKMTKIQQHNIEYAKSNYSEINYINSIKHLIGV